MVRRSGTVVAIVMICAAATRPKEMDMAQLGVEAMGQIVSAKAKPMDLVTQAADPDLPGTDLTDEHLIDMLGKERADVTETIFSAFDLEGFVKKVHNLYFDPAREHNDYQDPGAYVHFHNWDHARNVFHFTKWYATHQKSGLGQEQQFLIMLAALAHDVMHQGTANERKIVEQSFLGNVNTYATRHSWTLNSYARDLITQISNHSYIYYDREKKSIALTILAALGCRQDNECTDYQPNNQLTVLVENASKVIVERAPQKVLHAWITVKLLSDHNFPRDKLYLVAIPILMTSMKLHSMGLDGDSSQGIEAHVKEMAKGNRAQRLGLLLHFLDMGYVCQSFIFMKPLAGIKFRGRFLVESNNNGQALSDWYKVMLGQSSFGNDVARAYLNDLRNSKVIDPEVLPSLQSGLMRYLVEGQKSFGNNVVGAYLNALRDSKVIEPEVVPSLQSGLTIFLELTTSIEFQTELFRSLGLRARTIFERS